MDFTNPDAETIRYGEFVDFSLNRGLAEARKKRHKYYLELFTKALWEARPFIEATETDPETAKGFAFTGKEKSRAVRLIAALKETVRTGDAHGAAQTMLKMKRLAEMEGLEMPSLEYVPLPHALKN